MIGAILEFFGLGVLVWFVASWFASFFQTTPGVRPNFEPWPWRRRRVLSDRVTVDDWYERRHQAAAALADKLTPAVEKEMRRPVPAMPRLPKR